MSNVTRVPKLRTKFSTPKAVRYSTFLVLRTENERVSLSQVLNDKHHPKFKTRGSPLILDQHVQFNASRSIFCGGLRLLFAENCVPILIPSSGSQPAVGRSSPYKPIRSSSTLSYHFACGVLNLVSSSSGMTRILYYAYSAVFSHTSKAQLCTCTVNQQSW